jgi:hypothetical protein
MAAASQPQYVEQVQSNIPAWMQGYAAQLLGSVFGEQDPGTGQFVPGLIGMGYQPYMVPQRDASGNIVRDASGKPQMVAGQRTAEFAPLQEQGFERIAGMQTTPQLAQASGLAGLAGRRAGRMSRYSPVQAQNFYDSPQFREGTVGFERTQAAPSSQYQMGAAERVGAERFGTSQMQDYMSPYMEGVVERQKRGAVQDYMRQIPGIGAAAARAGAKGGTREALMQSEARRSLSERLGDIEAQGLQQAYQQAAGQFGQDRAAQMQAALANQQAGLTTGQSNLQALINQQQFGAGQGLTAQQMNQQAQLQAQQQALAQLAQANQFNQQNAAQRAQYGLAGANLAEQSRQFGAGLGLQGLQQQLAAAGTLGGLGMQQYQQGMGIAQAQLGAGGQQQALNQQMLNQQYQDFINQQQFPYKQAEFGMGILRGLPATGQTSTMYQQPGSLFGQIAGAGVGLGSLFGGLGQNS